VWLVCKPSLQVVDGGPRNEMSISFQLFRPDGVPLVADNLKSDNAHRVTVSAAGDYKLCFDNSASRFSSKVVFFDLIIERDSDDGDEEEDEEDEEEKEQLKRIFGANPTDADVYDMKVEDILDALRAIKDKMTRSRRFQDQIRSFESRDRSVAEHNFERVNFYSTMHVFGKSTTMCEAPILNCNAP